MFQLKPIAKESIPRALAKAERYRLLNEPREAESICRDVLAVDAENQDALVCLVLSLTDTFHGMQHKADEVRPLAARLSREYEREYYAGVIEERWGKALLEAGYPTPVVYDALRIAMAYFDRSESIAPPGNDDAALRWNACARFIERFRLAPAVHADPSDAEMFSDDVPSR
jgi:hypothetical protein